MFNIVHAISTYNIVTYSCYK